MEPRDTQQLNVDSPLPLYHQLAEVILSRIRSGEYPSGSRIPSENRLAADFAIGRPTARQATDLLVRKRVLVRRRGAGTFVQESPPREVDLFSLAGTISCFRDKGLPVSTRILEKPQLRAKDSGEENPFAGGPAYYLSRLTLVEDQPVLLEEIHLHPTLFTGIDRLDLAGMSLSRVVEEQYFMRPSGGTQHFRIGRPEGPRARLLEIAADTPILVVDRFLHFKQIRRAIYARLYCRTDRFVFSQQLGGMDHE
ncbi:MAG: GntR family transcriptional regulator [Thermodesulfobacteriota bacterium]